MPFLFKTTLMFFQNSYGWSETWFRINPNSAPNKALYVAENAAVKKMAQARINWAGDETWINGWRISAESAIRPTPPGGGFFRDAYLFFYGNGNFGLNRAVSMGTAAPPQVCLVTEHSPVNPGPNAYKSHRGIPQNMMLGGDFTGTVPFNKAFNFWKALLNTDGWGWLGNAAGTKNSADVLGIAAGVNNQPVVTLTAPMAIAPPLGQKVKVSLSGLLGSVQLNGVWVVKFSTPLIFTIQPRVVFYPYQGQGVATYNQVAYVQDDGTALRIRVAERKPGRPFELSRGRKRNRVVA